MNIYRCFIVACLLIFASAPGLAAEPLPSLEALGEASRLGDCHSHGDGAISCTTMASLPAGLDAFVEMIAPPCAATLGTLADLPASYKTFVTAAQEQYNLALIQKTGLANCPNSCACAGCIAVNVGPYVVPVCLGCTACCTELQTASCNCQAPSFWMSTCSCT